MRAYIYIYIYILFTDRSTVLVPTYILYAFVLTWAHVIDWMFTVWKPVCIETEYGTQNLNKCKKLISLLSVYNVVCELEPLHTCYSALKNWLRHSCVPRLVLWVNEKLAYQLNYSGQIQCVHTELHHLVDEYLISCVGYVSQLPSCVLKMSFRFHIVIKVEE